MLDTILKEQVRELFGKLKESYTFRFRIRPDHPSRKELETLLTDTASCSSQISCQFEEGDDLELAILRNSQETGIVFRAVPNGHEFSSLLLAILNADGKGKNLPDSVLRRRVQALCGPIELTTYMSLTCTNCPDVVQALNLMAILNPAIRHTAVDGALYPELMAEMNIQAVPAVYLNGKPLHIGRGSLGELLEKLETQVTVTPIQEEPIERRFDLLVAGGGPSGVSAAIYAARKGQKVAVVAGRIGGQVNETVGIENLISVRYTTGKELADNLRRHLETYDIAIFDNRQIESFELENSDKILRTKGGEVFRAPALIIATGASWRRLNVPGEREYTGRGVAFCPHCDGPFYKNKPVAVIGGGNSGIEAAIDLAGICSEVTVVEFMENLKADTVLQEKLRSLPNVKVLTNHETLEIEGDGNKMTALHLRNRQNSEPKVLPVSGVFIQIGLVPNSTLFRQALETNRSGEILTDKNGRTSMPGVYAAGDVTDVSYKQIIIAMGEGAKAALSAFNDSLTAGI